jgi:DNA-binding XRE family transcriptional regulator
VTFIISINISIFVGYNPSGYSLSSFNPQTDKVLVMKVKLDDLKEIISSNIKKYRKLKGLSQEKLGLISGIDRSYMSEIERCIANPSIEAILRISNALEVTPEDLLKGIKKR